MKKIWIMAAVAVSSEQARDIVGRIISPSGRADRALQLVKGK